MFYVNKNNSLIRFLIGAKLVTAFLRFTQSSGVINFGLHSRDIFPSVTEKGISSVTENGIWTSETLSFLSLSLSFFSLANL